MSRHLSYLDPSLSPSPPVLPSLALTSPIDVITQARYHLSQRQSKSNLPLLLILSKQYLYDIFFNQWVVYIEAKKRRRAEAIENFKQFNSRLIHWRHSMLQKGFMKFIELLYEKLKQKYYDDVYICHERVVSIQSECGDIKSQVVKLRAVRRQDQEDFERFLEYEREEWRIVLTLAENVINQSAQAYQQKCIELEALRLESQGLKEVVAEISGMWDDVVPSPLPSLTKDLAQSKSQSNSFLTPFIGLEEMAAVRFLNIASMVSTRVSDFVVLKDDDLSTRLYHLYQSLNIDIYKSNVKWIGDASVRLGRSMAHSLMLTESIVLEQWVLLRSHLLRYMDNNDKEIIENKTYLSRLETIIRETVELLCLEMNADIRDQVMSLDAEQCLLNLQSYVRSQKSFGDGSVHVRSLDQISATQYLEPISEIADTLQKIMTENDTTVSEIFDSVHEFSHSVEGVTQMYDILAEMEGLLDHYRLRHHQDLIDLNNEKHNSFLLQMSLNSMKCDINRVTEWIDLEVEQCVSSPPPASESECRHGSLCQSLDAQLTHVTNRLTESENLIVSLKQQLAESEILRQSAEDVVTTLEEQLLEYQNIDMSYVNNWNTQYDNSLKRMELELNDLKNQVLNISEPLGKFSKEYDSMVLSLRHFQDDLRNDHSKFNDIDIKFQVLTQSQHSFQTNILNSIDSVVSMLSMLGNKPSIEELHVNFIPKYKECYEDCINISKMCTQLYEKLSEELSLQNISSDQVTKSIDLSAESSEVLHETINILKQQLLIEIESKHFDQLNRDREMISTNRRMEDTLALQKFYISEMLSNRHQYLAAQADAGLFYEEYGRMRDDCELWKARAMETLNRAIMAEERMTDIKSQQFLSSELSYSSSEDMSLSPSQSTNAASPLQLLDLDIGLICQPISVPSLHTRSPLVDLAQALQAISTEVSTIH